MDVIKIEKGKAITSGIITANTWTMSSNGCRYLYFYCDRWEILSDNMMPVDGFRSSEHWQLAAVNSTGDVIAIFPGCQVKAWIFCNEKPKKTDETPNCCYLQ